MMKLWYMVPITVKEVTEWVNSFVIVENEVPVDSSNAHSAGHSVQKKLWICLEPRDLNEALEREPYYAWSIEELLGKFHCMTWFTITDFNKGYWMVELHPDSRKLTIYGVGYWNVPVDKTPNGLQNCSGCFPKETWCNFSQCTKCHRNCWWHDHLCKNQSGTWWKLLKLFGIMQKEQFYIEFGQNAIQTAIKLPYLDIHGVIKDYQQIQRKLKL